eukprot:322732-Hanusia_phi.AAC.1
MGGSRRYQRVLTEDGVGVAEAGSELGDVGVDQGGEADAEVREDDEEVVADDRRCRRLQLSEEHRAHPVRRS